MNWLETGRRLWLPLLIILWLATGVRFYRLDAQSFWNDEGNSARLSERAPALIIAGTAGDIHPPLYYLTLAAWRQAVGSSEFGLRALSAMAGIVTVAATLALVRLWSGDGARRHRSVWAAGLLTAVAPPLVYYSQEARMYSLLALLAVLSTVLFERLRARPDPGRAAAYAIVLAAGLYTHYFFPAVIAAHFLLALTSPPRRLWPSLPAAWLAAALLYAPWLPIFWRQAGGRPASSPAIADFLAAAGRWLVAGETLPPAMGVIGSGATLLLLAAAVRRAERGQWGRLAAVVVPVGLMALAGTTRPAFLKFLVVAVPALWALVASVWGTPARSRQMGSIVALLTGVVLGIMVVSLQNLFFDPAHARADYRAMAARIAADSGRVAVVLDAPNQWEVFTYYYPDVDDVYPLPLGAADPARIDQTLTDVAAGYDRIYAVFWGEAERDPERLVERWLDAHAFKAVDSWYDDVRLVTYALPPDETTPVTPLAVRVGDDITLEGVVLGTRAVAPGEIVPLTLLWRTERPLAVRYKVFVHLVGADGRLVAQRDAEPGGGLALTTTWPSDVTIRDNHGLLIPLDLPPGRYDLRVGLYDVADPANRLPIANGIDDALSLGLISVRP